ncbi:MAG TPA: hypothetical protein DD726_05200 [Phycisphaerales bacterium]|nr:hypothetical protein [Phycisphaerales bacterium]
MANDGGIIATIEQAMADVLKVIQHNAVDVFETAEPWNYQIDVSEGGLEAFGKYSAFSFPRYMPPTSAGREGDGDLKQVLRFGILIGKESKVKGVARTGNAGQIGISKIRDLVIAALDNWHPGEGFLCDPFHYITDELEVDTPTRYALIMYFEANMITN